MFSNKVWGGVFLFASLAGATVLSNIGDCIGSKAGCLGPIADSAGTDPGAFVAQAKAEILSNDGCIQVPCAPPVDIGEIHVGLFRNLDGRYNFAYQMSTNANFPMGLDSLGVDGIPKAEFHGSDVSIRTDSLAEWGATYFSAQQEKAAIISLNGSDLITVSFSTNNLTSSVQPGESTATLWVRAPVNYYSQEFSAAIVDTVILPDHFRHGYTTYGTLFVPEEAPEPGTAGLFLVMGVAFCGSYAWRKCRGR